MAVDFDFNGTFRVQSRMHGRPGRIAGNWLPIRHGVICSDDVNRTLARNAHWSGLSVNLRAAIMTRREGMFHDVSDNLYKIECFEPLGEGRPFPCHIVDVLKALAQWHHRWPLVASLFTESHVEDLACVVEDLEGVIANEYCCHEAGHVLGRAVQTKTQNSYFSPGDRVRWPLIWVEEFRADLHSYLVALELMTPKAAAAMFVYNCLARWAGDALSVRDQSYGYGAVPFLLFILLLDLGFLEIVRSKSALKLAIATASVPEIVCIMERCHLHALKELTEVELATYDPLEWGINAARYYRERVLRNPLREDYLRLLSDATQ
jgi:hypothetical protein